MDSPIIMMCKFDGVTAGMVIHPNWTYEKLIQYICGKFSSIDPHSISLRYSFTGCLNCMLENDEDLEIMFSLVAYKGIQHVDVVVYDDKSGILRHNIRSGSCSSGDNSMCLDAAQMEARLDYDKSKEIISPFSSLQEKTLLSSSWAHGILDVGQKFEGGARQFRTVLCKYAIECGFEFVYVKNDLTRVTAQCSYKDSGCGWFVHARILPYNGYFYIRKLNNVHTCGSVVRTPKNKHMTSNLVGGIIIDQVCDKPLKRPIDVLAEFKSNYGLNISYHQAWMGVEKARGEIFGHYSMSFDQLRWYVDAVKSSNPGSDIVLECDNLTNQFKRIFVAFKACIDGFNHCRPLLLLDGTFLKGRYKGILLSATAKDGNQGLFPLCLAIVDVENKENWHWFVEHLSSILSSNREITFLSDRNPGLVEAVNLVFPTSYHGYFIQHLKRNLRNHLRGHWNTYREKMVNLFDKCAYAPTVDIFQQSLNDLMREGGNKVKDFLSDLPFEHWTNAYCKGSRYGETSFNEAELFNNWIKEEQHLPITSMLDTIRIKLMSQISTRREMGKKWTSVVCPVIDEKLHCAINDSRAWNVSMLSEGVYEVHSSPSVCVDLGKHTCSCCMWQLTGFPCAHVVGAVKKSGSDLNAYVDKYYHVESFRSCYASPIYPVPNNWKAYGNMEDNVIRPPVSMKQPGMPKKKRIPSIQEKVKQIRCSGCGKMGNHNRKSCKEALQY